MMKIEVQAFDLPRLLKGHGQPPIKLDKGMMTSMSPGLIAAEEKRDRRVIDRGESTSSSIQRRRRLGRNEP